MAGLDANEALADAGAVRLAGKAVRISGGSWGLRPLLCGKALPSRLNSPKYYCLPPREGAAFTRRQKGRMKSGGNGKAQPFRIASGGAAGRTPARESKFGQTWFVGRSGMSEITVRSRASEAIGDGNETHSEVECNTG